MKAASCAASQVEDSDMSDEDGDEEDEDEEITPIKPAKKQKQWAKVVPWWPLGAMRWRFQEYGFCTRHRFSRKNSAFSLNSTDVAGVQNHQTQMFHHLKMSSTVTQFWICFKWFQKVDSKACVCVGSKLDISHLIISSFFPFETMWTFSTCIKSEIGVRFLNSHLWSRKHKRINATIMDFILRAVESVLRVHLISLDNSWNRSTQGQKKNNLCK